MKKHYALLMILLMIASLSGMSQSQTKQAPVSQKNQGTVMSKADQSKFQQVEKPVYTCSMHPKVTSDNPGKCPECKMNLVKKEAGKMAYSCPMHLEVIKDGPGKCPKCGMFLEKKETKKLSTPSKK